jgi:hypothetical protein
LKTVQSVKSVARPNRGIREIRGSFETVQSVKSVARRTRGIRGPLPETPRIG